MRSLRSRTIKRHGTFFTVIWELACVASDTNWREKDFGHFAHWTEWDLTCLFSEDGVYKGFWAFWTPSPKNTSHSPGMSRGGMGNRPTKLPHPPAGHGQSNIANSEHKIIIICDSRMWITGEQAHDNITQADPPAAAATATAEASAPAASATYGCASWLTTRQAHIRALQRVCASRSVGEL